MSLRALLTTLALAGITGCSGLYTVEPLSAEHPANPESAAAPIPPESQTLAYDQPAKRPAPMDSMQHMDHGSGDMNRMDDGGGERDGESSAHGQHDHDGSDAAETGSGEKGGRQ